MEITLTKQVPVQETLNIQTPCWLHDRTSESYHFINERGDLVTVRNGMVVLWVVEDKEANPERIEQALKVSHSCTEAEFKAALDKQLFRIEESCTGVNA